MYCSIVASSATSGFVAQLAQMVRFFLHFGLFSIWGISVYRRIIQLQARLHFVVIAVLMLFWLTLREFRWNFVYNPNVSRLFWYSYYIPILLILLLSFFISLSVGKSEKYLLPKWTGLLFLPTLLLLGLVMTNDIHQWVFILPANAMEGFEYDYRYGLLFYVIAIWCGTCILATFITLFVKSRLLHTAGFLWLPLVPIFIAALYAITYVLRLPVLDSALGDATFFSCCLFMAFFESCIQCGFIQTNTCYFDIFNASLNLSAQITDDDYNVRYAARDAGVLLKEDMVRAETQVVLLADGRRLRNIRVCGGHAIWTEDIYELLELQESLAETREELRERNEFLKMEYEQEKEYRQVMEQNRLYDLLQRETQSQLDKVGLLTAKYEEVETEEERRLILSKIVILGSYIKRRKDFVLMMETSDFISENRLKSALEESFRSLRLAGIRGGYVVDTGRESLEGPVVMLAYDFFEHVLEMALDELRYIAVRVVCLEGELRCAVALDSSSEDAELRKTYTNMSVLSDEDGSVEYILPIRGGESL